MEDKLGTWLGGAKTASSSTPRTLTQCMKRRIRDPDQPPPLLPSSLFTQLPLPRPTKTSRALRVMQITYWLFLECRLLTVTLEVEESQRHKLSHFQTRILVTTRRSNSSPQSVLAFEMALDFENGFGMTNGFLWTGLLA